MRNKRKQQTPSENVEKTADSCLRGVGVVTMPYTRLMPEEEIYNNSYIEGYRDGCQGRTCKIKSYETGATSRYDPEEWTSDVAKFYRQEDYGDELFYNRLMEQKPREREAEAEELQVLTKRIGENIGELISSDTIPEESKAVVLKNIIRDISEACKGNIPQEALEAPDLSEIPLWQGRKLDGMALEFLKTHYGQWLPACKDRFGGGQEVFQDQIRAHDSKLMQGVINQLREEEKGDKLSNYVKPRSARVDRELENTDPNYLRKAHRLREASRRRGGIKA